MMALKSKGSPRTAKDCDCLIDFWEEMEHNHSSCEAADAAESRREGVN